MGFRISTEVGRLAIDMVWAEIVVAALAGSLFYGAIAARRAGGDLLASVLSHREGQVTTGQKPATKERGMTMKKTLLAAGMLLAGLGAGQRPGQADAPAQVGHAGPVRRLLRRQGQGLLQGSRSRRDHQAGRPDIAPPQVIAGGGADVIVDWMPSALATREKGVPLVNIAQPFKKSGMMLTCRKETGIKSPEDLKSRTLGVWFFGNEYPFLSWMAKLGSRPTVRPDGVNVIKQGFNVDPLLQKQADCISTMTYNEYWQVIDAGIKADDLVVFKYEDEGVATLEDGLYTTEAKLNDPKTRRCSRPLREGLDEGLGMGAGQWPCGRQDRARQRRDRRPEGEPSEAHDG